MQEIGTDGVHRHLAVEDFVKDLNEKQAMMRMSVAYAALAGGLGFLFFFPIVAWLPPSIAGQISFGAFCVTLAAVLVGVFIGNKKDEERRVVVRNYDLAPGEERRFRAIDSAFQALAQCEGKWHWSMAGTVRDMTTWKRQAGASHLVDRRAAHLSHDLPGILRSNIVAPAMRLGRHAFYFLPDTILIWNGSQFGAVAYGDLDVGCQSGRFIETGRVPSDAKVVDYTWAHPNRDGGPDRRFNNNYQIPVCAYDQMCLVSDSGVREALQFSRLGVAQSFIDAISSAPVECARRPMLERR